MKSRRLILSGILLSFVFNTFTANGASENGWSQPIVTNAMGHVLGTARISSSQSGWLMADDFEFGEPHYIHTVRWWGSFSGEFIPRETSTNQNQFTLALYEAIDTGGNWVPANLLWKGFVDVVGHPVGTNQLGEIVYVYEAGVARASSLALQGRFFLSIQNLTEENWGWHDSIRDDVYRCNAHVSLTGEQGPWFKFYPKTDLAFELVVPEPKPEVMVLVALGVAAIFCLRMR